MATTNVNEVEKMLDDLDPSTVRASDAVHFRRIIAAQDGVARAYRELHDAVRAAREAGDSWLSIGMAFGCDRASGPKALRTLTGQERRCPALPEARHPALLAALDRVGDAGRA